MTAQQLAPNQWYAVIHPGDFNNRPWIEIVDFNTCPPYRSPGALPDFPLNKWMDYRDKSWEDLSPQEQLEFIGFCATVLGVVATEVVVAIFSTVSTFTVGDVKDFFERQLQPSPACMPCPPSARKAYDSAKSQVVPQADPLVIDLDGDGFETMSLEESRACFDHDGDAFAELTAWLHPDDGFLVWDRIGGGIINDGSEMFGNAMMMDSGERGQGGVQVLAQLDSNADGQIDASDAAFSQLGVSQRVVMDGVFLPNDLHALAEAGVKSIKLDPSPDYSIDDQGNIRYAVATIEKSDGSM